MPGKFGIDWDQELNTYQRSTSAPKPQSKFGINWDLELQNPSTGVSQPIRQQQISPQPQEKGMFAKAKDWVTGSDRTEFDYPELPTTAVLDNHEMIPIQQKLAYDQGNKIRQSNTLMRNLGVSADDISFDQYGNQAVKFKGKNYYVNKPGASSADLTQLVHDVGLYAIPGMGVGKAVKGASLLTKSLAGGATATGTSIAEDLMSDPSMPVDKVKAGIIGALGFGGELVAPIANKLLTTVFRSKKLYVDGKLTDRGKKVLEENGIDPENITDDMANVFKKRAEKSAAPALEEGVEYHVPVSRGQLTGDVHQQGLEQAMLHGAYGEEPQRIMLGLEKQTQDALRRNAEHIKSQYGAGVEYAGEGAGKIFQDVVEKRKAIRAPVSTLYSDAKKLDAFVPNKHMESFVSDVEQRLINETVPIEGAVKQRIDTLKAILKNGKDPSIHQLMGWRKLTSSTGRRLYNTDPQSSYGLGVLKKQFDDMIQSDITADLIVGDASAPALYKKAIKSWSDRANLIGEAFEKKILKNPNITDKEALNFIIGSSKTTTNQQAARMVGEIKRIFGAESDQMRMLKDEMFIKIMNGQPADGFSAQKYINSLKRFETDNRAVFNEIFTDRERAALHSLGDVSKKTIYSDKAVNPPRTAHAIARWTNDVFGGAGKISNIVMARFADKYNAVSARQDAIKAITTPHVTQKFLPNGFVGPSLAGVLYDDDRL